MAVLLRDLLNLARFLELAQVELIGPQSLVEHLTPQLGRAGALLLLDDGADLGFRARAFDDLEPVLRWRLRRGGDDFDRVAGFQSMLEGDDLSVDLRADALVPHVGVNGVGKIQWSRAVGKLPHFAFGRKDENVFGEKIDLHRLEKLVRI